MDAFKLPSTSAFDVRRPTRALDEAGCGALLTAAGRGVPASRDATDDCRSGDLPVRADDLNALANGSRTPTFSRSAVFELGVNVAGSDTGTDALS